MGVSSRAWSTVVVVTVVILGDVVENFDSEDTRDLNETFFISEIFAKYGNSNIITYELAKLDRGSFLPNMSELGIKVRETFTDRYNITTLCSECIDNNFDFLGFEHLLENLGLGKLNFETKHDVSIHKINGTFREVHDELFLHKHDHRDNATAQDVGGRRKRNVKAEERAIENLRRKCLTAQDILTAYGLKPYHDVVISPSQYLQICPAIVYELDYKLCQIKEPETSAPKQEERSLVWTYASVSIVAMGLSGMACVMVVPWMRRGERCSVAVQFLVSLAVGTLCGDALIHLVPQVFCGKSESETTAVSKGTVALTAIFFFFIVECVLKGAREKKHENADTSKEMIPLEGHKHNHSHAEGQMKTVASMAIMGDVLHNVTDGLSIGAAFSASLSSGFASAIAIFCHELPHELGDYAILLASGMSLRKALLYNVLSSVFSLLGMVAGVLLGEIEDAASWINTFTAGSFLYIALSDLVPEMKTMQENSTCKSFLLQTTGLAFGGLLMLAIALYENQIEGLLS